MTYKKHIFGLKREHQNTFHVVPYAFSPLPTCMNQQKNDVQSEYNKNGTILSALESYQCVINFI